jgi:AcrR family transcriptional regulator
MVRAASTRTPPDRRAAPRVSPANAARTGPRKPSKASTISDGQLADLGAWSAEGLLPELIPSQQERSLRTAAAMLETGRRLLVDRSLEDLSVELICEQSGTTVGAFYGRFESKLAFFTTLQRVQVINSQTTLNGFMDRHAKGKADLDTLCEDMVRLTVNNFRANVGVLRASLQHTQEGMWRPFKQSGDRYRVALLDKFSPHLAHPPEVRRLRILFAYEALAGVLVHATLNDPGPLGLHDDRLEGELVRLVKSYLKAPHGNNPQERA